MKFNLRMEVTIMSETSGIKDLLKKIEEETSGFKESIITKLESIVEEVKLSNKAVEDVEKEIETTETRIKKYDDQITELKDKKSNLEQAVKNLKANIEKTNNKIAELKDKLSNLKAKLEEANEELAQLKSENEKKEEELEGLNQKVKQLEEEVTRIKRANEEEFAEKSVGLNKIREELSNLVKENAAVDFILAEGSYTTPEVDILTILFQTKVSSIEEIKRGVKVPPVMTVRTVKKLAEMKILSYDESTGQVKLLL